MRALDGIFAECRQLLLYWSNNTVKLVKAIPFATDIFSSSDTHSYDNKTSAMDNDTEDNNNEEEEEESGRLWPRLTERQWLQLEKQLVKALLKKYRQEKEGMDPDARLDRAAKKALFSNPPFFFHL